MIVEIKRNEKTIGFVTEEAVKGNFVYGPRSEDGLLKAVSHAECVKLPHDSIVAVSQRMLDQLQDPSNYVEES